MNIEIFENVDIEIPINYTNVFWKFLNNRTAFTTDASKKILDTYLKIITINKTLIFKRTLSDKLVVEEDANGSILLLSPTKPEEIKNNKENSTFILAKNMVFVEFSYPGDCNESVLGLPAKIVVDILSSKIPEKAVETKNNDIFINNNKIAGIDTNKNNTGIHDFLAINFYYDKVFFSNYLTEQDVNKANISGIGDEIIGYTPSQFITDFVEKFKYEFNLLHPNE